MEPDKDDCDPDDGSGLSHNSERDDYDDCQICAGLGVVQGDGEEVPCPRCGDS